MKGLLKTLTFSLLFAFVVSALLWWSILSHARSELAERRAQLAGAGEPLTIAELTGGAAPVGVETLRWLHALPRTEHFRIHWSDRALHRLPDLDLAIAEEREGDNSTETLEALERWRDLMESGDDEELPTLLNQLKSDTQAIGNPAFFGEAQRLALWLVSSDSETTRRYAQEVRALTPCNLSARIAEEENAASMFLSWRIRGRHQQLVRHFARRALRPALEGDAEEAISRLDLAFHAAELESEPDGVDWHLKRYDLHRKCLVRLSHLLPLLPLDADLAVIEERLAAQDTHADFLRALRCERVFGLRGLDAMRRGLYDWVEDPDDWNHDSDDPTAPYSFRWTLDMTESSYLGLISDAIEELEATWSKEGYRLPEPPSIGGPELLGGLNVARGALPRLENARYLARAHERMVLEARLALAIRRDGLEAARPALERAAASKGHELFDIAEDGNGFLSLNTTNDGSGRRYHPAHPRSGEPWTWWIPLE